MIYQGYNERRSEIGQVCGGPSKYVRSIPGDFSGRSLSETANQSPVMWYSTGQPVPDSWLKIALSDISNSKAGIWILFYYHLPECNCEASSLTGQTPV